MDSQQGQPFYPAAGSGHPIHHPQQQQHQQQQQQYGSTGQHFPQPSHFPFGFHPATPAAAGVVPPAAYPFMGSSPLPLPQPPLPAQQPVPMPAPGSGPMHLIQGFFNPWEPPPPPVPAPADSDLQKRIEKLVQYSVKNGPQFEALMKEKQKDDPAYAFLFGGEGHGYYRYKLWLTINPPAAGFHPSHAVLPPINSSVGLVNPPFSVHNAASMNVVPQPPPPSFPAFHEQQQQHQQPQLLPQQHEHQQFPLQQRHHQSQAGLHEGGRGSSPLKAATAVLPSEVAAELKATLDNLTGTKESIKGAKTWFMQRSHYAPSLTEALRDRVLALEDPERQLHVIYLVNDILFSSLQHRAIVKELDNEALAFRPVLGSMLAAICHNRKNADTNRECLEKIVRFWGEKDVYDRETIKKWERDMRDGVGWHVRETSPASLGAAGPITSSTHPGASFPGPWQPEQARINQVGADQSEQTPPFTGNVFSSSGLLFPPSGAPQVIPASIPPLYPTLNPPFLPPAPTVPSVQAPSISPIRSVDQNPYPLFPPGLIPGMVRKMQIGSGVPYSSLSPLDIPTVIPPSTTAESYIMERVAKFFKEIGEVDPLDGRTKQIPLTEEDGSYEEDRDRHRDGGARIPPPPHMLIDPDTGTLPDGSMEHRPGMVSSGRLGLGAAADPNEMSQYDDVYTSYRKQRSTNYHTSLSARAAAR